MFTLDEYARWTAIDINNNSTSTNSKITKMSHHVKPQC